MPTKFQFILALLTILSSTANAQTYEEQYAKCSEKLPVVDGDIDPSYFVHLKERDLCLAGSVAPNFTATSIDGKEIDLSKLKGKVVVLNFWFTRCEPCIAEMPDLNKLVDHYSSKDVAFISFSYEEETVIKAFLEKQPFKFTTVAKSEYIRRDILKLFSMWPYSVIIDREGKISKMWSGNPNRGDGTNVYNYYKEAIDNLL